MTNNEKFLIIRDRAELIYKDFTLNLLYYIEKYKQDRKTLRDDDDIFNHYSFCYNKTCEDFLSEGIDFRDNNDLKKYFFVHYYSSYYTTEDDVNVEDHISFWETIFNVDDLNDENLNQILIGVYKMFDASINNKKNIYELV